MNALLKQRRFVVPLTAVGPAASDVSPLATVSNAPFTRLRHRRSLFSRHKHLVVAISDPVFRSLTSPGWSEEVYSQ